MLYNAVTMYLRKVVVKQVRSKSTADHDARLRKKESAKKERRNNDYENPAEYAARLRGETNNVVDIKEMTAEEYGRYIMENLSKLKIEYEEERRRFGRARIDKP